jgi:hypothetical protein
MSVDILNEGTAILQQDSLVNRADAPKKRQAGRSAEIPPFSERFPVREYGSTR